MKKTLYAIAFSAALSSMAFAADFSGKLMDTACLDQKQPGKACNATASTTSFTIDVNGKQYKLDANGNSKTAAAIKDRADRSTDPAKALTTAYSAKVSGTEKDGTITVENVEVQ